MSSSTAQKKTASTHRSAFVRGTHQFDIVGYNVRKALGVSNSIRSAAFEAGGHTWALDCCFDRDGKSLRLASVSLELLTARLAKDVVAMASLKVEDPTGRGRWPAAAVWRSDEAHTFSSAPGNTWKLPVPDGFHEARHVKGGRLTIHCAVDVLEEDSTPAETRSCFVAALPPPSIARDLHGLLEERRLTDVTFAVEGAEIRWHRLVLAMRSPVFAAELLGHMREGAGGGAACRVAIDDMSASTFNAMLRFVYTDELPIKPAAEDAAVRGQRACREKAAARRRASMARDLLVAADRYDLERLRLMCEEILREGVDDAATALSTLMLVHGRDSCRQLEACCVEFMASDPDVYAAVKETEEYRELKESFSSFIVEVTDKVATHSLARNSFCFPSCSSSSSASTRRPHKRQKTASMYTSSEVASGTHDFRIPNFSAMQRRHGNCQPIRSGAFRVGGYDWKVWVYPSGFSDQEAGFFVSVFLQLVSDPRAANVRARTTFKIYDPSKESPPNTCAGVDVYTKERRSYGYNRFIDLESAKKKYLGHDGSLTVRCKLAVVAKECLYTTSTTGAGTAAIAVPPSNIAWHLEQMLVSQRGSDVKFLVQESEFHAHGVVIAARSPVLYETIVASTADNKDHVRIDDVKAVVFKALLHFIYTDDLPPPIDDDDLLPATDGRLTTAGDMLAAACRFRLDRMRAMCENMLSDLICKETAWTVLKLARRHSCQELQDYCLEYISLPHVVKDVMKAITSSLESQGD